MARLSEQDYYEIEYNKGYHDGAMNIIAKIEKDCPYQMYDNENKITNDPQESAEAYRSYLVGSGFLSRIEKEINSEGK